MRVLKSERSTKDYPIIAKEEVAAAHLSLRTVTALEVASVIITVLVTAWAIAPMQLNNRWLASVPALLALGMIINSHRLRGETLRELGFTARHFGRALMLLFIPMLVGSAILIGIGYLYGSLQFNTRFSGFRSFLPLWGLMQQYVLQAFIYRRLRFILVDEHAPEAEQIWRTRLAIFAAASLFAFVHAPNLALMVLTLISGCVWSWVYERAPNLYALGLSHGLMSTIAMSSLPAWLLQSMSVGYKHFIYQNY